MSLSYHLYLNSPGTSRQVLERVAQQPAFASAIQQDTSDPDLVGYWVSNPSVFVSTCEWINQPTLDEVYDLEPSIEATFGFAPTQHVLFSIQNIDGVYQVQGIVDVITTVVFLAEAPYGGMLLLKDFSSMLLWQADRLVLDNATGVWEPEHLQLLPEPYTFESLKQF